MKEIPGAVTINLDSEKNLSERVLKEIQPFFENC